MSGKVNYSSVLFFKVSAPQTKFCSKEFFFPSFYWKWKCQTADRENPTLVEKSICDLCELTLQRELDLHQRLTDDLLPCPCKHSHCDLLTSGSSPTSQRPVDSDGRSLPRSVEDRLIKQLFVKGLVAQLACKVI